MEKFYPILVLYTITLTILFLLFIWNLADEYFTLVLELITWKMDAPWWLINLVLMGQIIAALAVAAALGYGVVYGWRYWQQR